MIEELGQRLYSYQEAAGKMQVGVSTVRRMLYDGRLDKLQLGRRVYIPEVSLKNYLAGKASKKFPVRKTYDVHFYSDTSSDAKGWSLTKRECREWIEAHIGSDYSYFADYKDGVVSVVCNETGVTVYQRLIPNI